MQKSSVRGLAFGSWERAAPPPASSTVATSTPAAAMGPFERLGADLVSKICESLSQAETTRLETTCAAHCFAPGEDEWECDVKGDGCLRPEEGRADSEAAETCWISTEEGLDWCACATCAAADHGHPHPLRLRWTL